MMERSRKIFFKIKSASHQVITAANEYADREDICGVQRSHFQLEQEMQRVSVACECFAGILDRSSTSDAPSVDVRLQDWLATAEPQICFDTLNQMEKLLQEDVSLRTPTRRRVQRKAVPIDKVVNLFDSRKECFHFLFSTEILNQESGVQPQRDKPYSRHPTPQGGSNVLEGRARVSAQADTLTTESDEVLSQDRCTIGQRRDKAMADNDAKKLEEILKWLDGFNCAEKQDITLSFRQPGTCKWLFDTPQYGMWRDGESSFLWLRGKPGAGKSVLASTVIDTLEKSLRDGEFLAFFYCDFRDERSTSAAEAMRSILFQLLCHFRGSSVDPESLFDNLVKAQQRGGATRNSAKQLAEFISTTARLLGQKSLVVIDALDECKDLQDLLEGITMLKGDVQLLVTSRPLQIIKDSLSGLPFMSMDEMEGVLSADINLHVTRELDARRRLRYLDTGFKAEIYSVLCDKADGMFRWIQCSINTLDRCTTRKEVRAALDCLPEGLDETYERILLAIDTKTREGQLAQRALVWLVAALRPLRLSELMEGLSIDLQKRVLDYDSGPMHNGVLLDACGSLVTYTEETDIIILSHFSVKEYLMGEFACAKLPQYHINWERAHAQLAQSCMCYISICLKRTRDSNDSSNTPGNGTGVRSKFSGPPLLSSASQPLLAYVLNDALGHFGELGPGNETVLNDIKVLEGVIQQYSAIWDNMFPSGQRVWHTPTWPESKHDLLLYILVAVAPDSLLRAYLRRVPLRPKQGTNPLLYTVYFNKKTHAQTLLRRGAKLNCRGQEIIRSSQALPLEVAFNCNRYEMLTYFVTEGSTVPQHIFTCSLSDYPVGIPIYIVRMLLQTDDFVEVADGLINLPIFRSAFFTFVKNRRIDESDLIKIIRRLVQVGYDPFAYSSDGTTLLYIAIEREHVSVVQYLLSLGAILPSNLLVSSDSWNAWQSPRMIRCLIENGANILADEESAFRIALQLFEDVDALETTKLLVGHGCDALQLDSPAATPLCTAVQHGRILTVQYLLALGAHLPSNLLFKMGSWHIERKAPIIQLLVENGANVLLRNEAGNSILHIALLSLCEDDALEAAEILVRYGCDFLEANSHGKTSLHIAVERGHVSVAKCLLFLGAPLPSDVLVTCNSWRILRKTPMIRFLVENGADVRVHTKTGDSILHITLLSLQEDDVLDAAKLLVNHGCDVLEANSSGKTPLHVAVERGHSSVAQYFCLLDAPIPPDLLVTSNLWDAWQNTRIIHFLIRNGADVLVRNEAGDSILHVALSSLCEEYALEATEILVNQGCDAFESSPGGKTPLHIAVERGYLSVAQYLISIGAPLPSESLLIALEVRGTWQRTPMLRLLVENGASVRLDSSNEVTVLHIALLSLYEADALEAAMLLVDCDDSVLGADSRDNTPVSIAIQRGHVSTAQYLLSLGARIPPDLHIMLGWQWIRQQVPMLRLLVEGGADVLVRDEADNSILHIAFLSFRPDNILQATKLLVSRGCNALEANVHGKTPLHLAAERGYVTVVQYFLSFGVLIPSDLLVATLNSPYLRKTAPTIRCLVENGANVLVHTETGDAVLHVALLSLFEDDALEVAKLLIDHGCDPLEANPHGKAPLHIAIERGHVSVVEYLHSIGAPLPCDALLITLNPGRQCPSEPRMPVIKYLVDHGASVFTRASDGDSVLHIAIAVVTDDEVLQAMALFIAHGCDPAASNAHGATPLHIAVQGWRMSVTRYLLSLNIPIPSDILFTAIRHDISPNWADDDPLLHAFLDRTDPFSRYCHLGMIKILVTSGCDVHTCNAAGHTPVYAAIVGGQVAVVEYLLSRVGGLLSEELLLAAAHAPPDVRGQMKRLLNRFVMRSGDSGSPSPDVQLPPAKRTKYIHDA